MRHTQPKTRKMHRFWLSIAPKTKSAPFARKDAENENIYSFNPLVVIWISNLSGKESNCIVCLVINLSQCDLSWRLDIISSKFECSC